MVPNEKLLGWVVLGVRPIRGVEFGAADCAPKERAFFLLEWVRCGLDKEIAPDGTYSKYFPFGAMIERAQMAPFHNKLSVKGTPKHILKLRNIHIGNRRDKYRLYTLGEVSLHLLYKLVVEHIALGDGKESLLIQQLGVVLRELAKQDILIRGDIVAIGRNHKEQHGVTLDMSKEASAEATTLVCSLDDTRDVGHNEGVVVAHRDDAQVWL